MKVAINECYGGFSVSEKVIEALKEKGIHVQCKGYASNFSKANVKFSKMSFYLNNDDFSIESNDYNEWRRDTRLIEVIEEIGLENSNGSLSNLSIKDIPDDVEYTIEDYDGIESIHEVHRSW